MKHHPLWPILVGFCLGLIAEGAYADSPRPWICRGGLIVVWGVIAWHRRHRGGWWSLASLVIGLSYAPGHPPSWKEQRVSVTGEVCRAPVPTSKKRSAEIFDVRVSNSVFRVRPRGSVPTIHPGDRVHLMGTLRSFESARNPGQADRRRILWHQGISGIIELLPHPSACDLLDSGSKWNPIRWFYHWRCFLLARLHQNLDPVMASFGAALLLGIRTELDWDWVETFRCTGTFHLLAISGLHLALILGGIRWSLKQLGCRGSTLGIPLVVVATLYMGVADFAPSIVRAWAMTVVYSAGDIAKRPLRAREVIPAAALLVLVVHPHQIYSVGFQFSLCAVLGIVFLSGPITQAFASPRHPDERPHLSRKRALIRGAQSALFVSIAATLSTAPLSLYHFGQFVPWAPLASLLLVPWLTGMLTMLFVSLVLPGAVVDGTLHLLHGWLTAVLTVIDSLPGTPIIEHPTSPFSLCLFGGALIAFIRRKLGLSTLFTITSVVLFSLSKSPLSNNEFRLTVFALPSERPGHLCAVLQTSDKTIVCGMGGESKRAEKTLERGLVALGVSEIDDVILPRWSDATAGAFHSLAARFPVNRIWSPARRENRMPVPTERLVQVFQSRRINVGGVVVELHPTKQFDAIVIHLSVAGKNILVLGSVSGPDLHRVAPKLVATSWDEIVVNQDPGSHPAVENLLNRVFHQSLVVVGESSVPGALSTDRNGAFQVTWTPWGADDSPSAFR